MAEDPWREVLATAQATMRDQANFLSSYHQERPSGPDKPDDQKRCVLTRVVGQRFNPADATDQSTATAFCISRLARARDERYRTRQLPLGHEPHPLAEEPWNEILRTASSDFIANYAEMSPAERGSPDAGDIPNSYSSSIHLSAAAALLEWPELTQATAVPLTAAGDLLAQRLASWLCGTGYVTRVEEPSDEAPPVAKVLEDILFGDSNAYLTYLVVDGIADWREARLKQTTPTSAQAEEAPEPAAREGDETSPDGSAAGSPPETHQSDPGTSRTQPFDADELDAALKMAFDAALVAACRILAASSARTPSMFDALDLVSTIATVVRAGTARNSMDRFATAVVDAGIDLLLTDYLISDGSFAPKAPAFTVAAQRVPAQSTDSDEDDDESGPPGAAAAPTEAEVGSDNGGGAAAAGERSDFTSVSVTVSSAEIAEMLLSAKLRRWDFAMLSALAPAIQSICARAHGGRSWGAGATESKRRHVFAAISSWCALRQYENHSGEACAVEAATALRVPSAPPGNVPKPPKAIKRELQTYTIKPIAAGRRDLGSMSMVLHGPPGTAKTTIAKYIAAKLGWPLLEVTPATFLTSGIAGLETEVGRVFELLPDLRDTVVLFDEFEGVLGRRTAKVDRPHPSDASRFLTTSMLPRLHDLRDGGQIVFLIATNHSEDLDDAAIRPGRVDRILAIGPPDTAAKRAFIAKKLEDLRKAKLYRGDLHADVETWLRDVYPDSIDGLTYGYLGQMVRDALLLGDGATIAQLEALGADQAKRIQFEQPRDQGDQDSTVRGRPSSHPEEGAPG